MPIQEEIAQAQDQLRQADQNFQYATGDYIDVAIAEMAAAEARLNLLFRKAKQEAA